MTKMKKIIFLLLLFYLILFQYTKSSGESRGFVEWGHLSIGNIIEGSFFGAKYLYKNRVGYGVSILNARYFTNVDWRESGDILMLSYLNISIFAIPLLKVSINDKKPLEIENCNTKILVLYAEANLANYPLTYNNYGIEYMVNRKYIVKVGKIEGQNYYYDAYINSIGGKKVFFDTI